MKYKHYEVTKYLIYKHSYVHIINKQQLSPLHFAFESKDISLIQMIRSKLPMINEKNISELYSICQSNDIPMITEKIKEIIYHSNYNFNFIPRKMRFSQAYVEFNEINLENILQGMSTILI